MIIEKATVSDAEEILMLQKLSYKSEAEMYNDYEIPPMTQSLEDMRKEFGHKTFLKAIFDGKIVGSVRAEKKGTYCLVGRLMVHPEYQNQGIGKRLMTEIEKQFESCKRFELFTGNKSEKNMSLYRKLGYKEFSIEKINDKISLVYMEKKM